jgi:lipopolysaccharide transport system ATP-binding protein
VSETAIRSEGLSKLYRIGPPQRYKTLRDSLAGLPSMVTRPWRRKAPDTIWALREVSFEVQRGEAVGVIGRNGAGKSTLLKILSRITEPTEGRAEIRGRVGSLLEIGTGFHLELTGRENIFLSGAILGMRKAEIERKFHEIVEFAEVEKFLDTPVKHYSTGMYLRLAFAVAAHLEPEILLVDEVLAVGDAAFQKKCLGKMGDVAAEGRTVLFVSHNMASIEHLCGRCILLDNGRVRLAGESHTVIDSYISLTQTDGEGGSPGVADLTAHTNVYGNRESIIRQVRLTDQTGVARGTFRMGQPMVVEVELEGFADVPDGILGVTFKSHNGLWLASLNTGMRCDLVDAPRTRRETARLRLPRLPFTPGTYSIAISVTHGRIARIDYVEQAIGFNVVGADVYGSGYDVSAKYGLIFLDGAWQIGHA